MGKCSEDCGHRHAFIHTHTSTVNCVVDNWPVAADYNTKGTVGKDLAVSTPFSASTTYKIVVVTVIQACSACVPDASRTAREHTRME